MLCGIGALPGTIADRSIRFELKRKKKDEKVSRWNDRDATREAAPLHDALAVWALTALDELRAATPTDIPASLSDRAEEIWTPLFAIADLAGGEWPQAARKAAVELSGTADELDIGVELLTDIAAILETLPETDTAVASADLLAKLNALPEAPWSTWSKGEPMTGKALASQLKRFGIRSAGSLQLRPYGPVARGYRRDAFEDAFARYSVDEALKRKNANESEPETPISKRKSEDGFNALPSQKLQ
jgi:hypothetical protein